MTDAPADALALLDHIFACGACCQDLPALKGAILEGFRSGN